MPHVGDAPGDRQAVAAGHRARGSPFRAGDDLQQAGFAGAAGAEQGDEAAAGDVEAQPIEDDLLTETQAEIPHRMPGGRSGEVMRRSAPSAKSRFQLGGGGENLRQLGEAALCAALVADGFQQLDGGTHAGQIALVAVVADPEA